MGDKKIPADRGVNITITAPGRRPKAKSKKPEGLRHGPFSRREDDLIVTASRVPITVHDISALFFALDLPVDGTAQDRISIADHYASSIGKFFRLVFVQSVWAVTDPIDSAYLISVGQTVQTVADVAVGQISGAVDSFSSPRDPFGTSDVNYYYPDTTLLAGYRQEATTWRLPKAADAFGVTLGIGSQSIPLTSASSGWVQITDAQARYDAAVTAGSAAPIIEALRLEVLERTAQQARTWYHEFVPGPNYFVNFDHSWQIDTLPDGSEWPSDGTTDHRTWWIDHGSIVSKTAVSRFTAATEDIYYETFDTSDGVNFKITSEETYGSPEVSITAAKRGAKILLAPKLWKCTVTFNSRDFPGPADVLQTIVLTIPALTVPPGLFELFASFETDAPPDGFGGFNGFNRATLLRNLPITAGSISIDDGFWLGHSLMRNTFFTLLFSKRLENNIEGINGMGTDARITAVTAPAVEGQLVGAIQVNSTEKFYIWRRLDSVDTPVLVVDNAEFNAGTKDGPSYSLADYPAFTSAHGFISRPRP